MYLAPAPLAAAANDLRSGVLSRGGMPYDGMPWGGPPFVSVSLPVYWSVISGAMWHVGCSRARDVRDLHQRQRAICCPPRIVRLRA